MLIPSATIALLWSLRAQGRSDADILALLSKPLTPTAPTAPGGWFVVWRKSREA